MSATITQAGESQIALKQSQKKPLIIRQFIFAHVPGLDPLAPIDRTAGKPPAEQIVHVYAIPSDNAGYVNPNQVVYSAQLGSDIGDWDFNWVGLEDEDGVLFAVSCVPLQQKRKNIPPLQIGNNVTRNFLVAFDGAQALTSITIDASTWQHDFTVRLAGIDERERLSNRDLYGRACFFGEALRVVAHPDGWHLLPGTAYVEGLHVFLDEPLPLASIPGPGTVTLDVCLERELNDRVVSWRVIFGEQDDYTDSAGARHFCVALAHVDSGIPLDLRASEPVSSALIEHFAARHGDYPHLRARGTTKDDVDLGNLPNAKSDDPATNSSEILATTAALNKLQQQVGDSLVGMVAPFAMLTAPTGWIACDGTHLSRAYYPGLFARIGTTFGAIDGATFQVPDLRGTFVRAWSAGAGIDPGRVMGSRQDGQNAWHAHTASSGLVGAHNHAGSSTHGAGYHAHTGHTTYSGDHQHILGIGPNSGFNGAAGVGNGRAATLATDPAGNHLHGLNIDPVGDHAHAVAVAWDGSHTHAITVDPSGGSEARPINVALLYCIKY